MRTQYVGSVAELLRADAQSVVDEYRSVLEGTVHEFRDEVERARYLALVRAWGLFAHHDRFSAAADTPIAGGASPVEPVCRNCGGDSLVRDAAARWDADAQGWSMSGTYDSTYCDDCESESDTLCRWVAAGSRRASAA